MHLLESAGIIVLLLMTILFGVKKVPYNSTGFDCMSLDNTMPIRGILAIIVLLHHLSSYYLEFSFISPFKHVGYIAVALFFFLSGYGLSWGYQHKQNYLKNFLIKHILRLYIPYLICVGVYVVSIGIINRSFPTLSDILLSLIFLGPTNPVGWYVGELILFYIVFYISFSFTGKKRIIVFSILYCLLIVGLLLTPVKDIWTKSIIGFPMGMILYFKRQQIDRLILKKYILSIIVSFCIFALGVLVKILGEIHVVFSVKLCGNTISCLGSIIVLYCILLKLRFGNKFLRFFGSLSYEIYLYHVLLLTILISNSFIKEHSLACFCLVLTSTILISYVVHKINVLSTSFFKRL